MRASTPEIMRHKKLNSFSPVLRERSVRMVLERRNDHPSEWATIFSVAGKVGCAPQALHGLFWALIWKFYFNRR